MARRAQLQQRRVRSLLALLVQNCTYKIANTGAEACATEWHDVLNYNGAAQPLDEDAPLGTFRARALPLVRAGQGAHSSRPRRGGCMRFEIVVRATCLCDRGPLSFFREKNCG